MNYPIDRAFVDIGDLVLVRVMLNEESIVTYLLVEKIGIYVGIDNLGNMLILTDKGIKRAYAISKILSKTNSVT